MLKKFNDYVSSPVTVAIQIVYYYNTRLYMRKSVVTYLVIAMADFDNFA